MSVEIKFGLGNSVTRSVDHTSQIGDEIRTFLGVPPNAVLVYRGEEGYTGNLDDGSSVSFQTRSNSKA